MKRAQMDTRPAPRHVYLGIVLTSYAPFRAPKALVMSLRLTPPVMAEMRPLEFQCRPPCEELLGSTSGNRLNGVLNALFAFAQEDFQRYSTADGFPPSMRFHPDFPMLFLECCLTIGTNRVRRHTPRTMSNLSRRQQYFTFTSAFSNKSLSMVRRRPSWCYHIRQNKSDSTSRTMSVCHQNGLPCSAEWFDPVTEPA